MSESSFILSQSKFYTPSLNGAIFDGPFRIYFAQNQEPEALKVYFHLQNQLEAQFEEAKEVIDDKNIYIMIYPTQDVFERSFDSEPFYKGLAIEGVEDEFVIGLNGEISEGKLKYLTQRVKILLENWQCSVPAATIEFPKRVLEV